MATLLKWNESNKINGDHISLEVKQVYGWIITKDDHLVLVSKDNVKWQFPGGKPNLEENFVDTLTREVLEETSMTGKDPLVIIKEKGLEQVSDAGKLEGVCQKVLEENPGIVEDYNGGKEKAFAALVGKVMAATKGQANPGMVTEILKRIIG